MFRFSPFNGGNLKPLAIATPHQSQRKQRFRSAAVLLRQLPPGGSQGEGTTSNSQPMHHVVPEALGRQVGDPYGMHWIIKRSYICNSCNRRVCLVQIPFPCVPKSFMPCTFILQNEKSQAQITELAILATRNGLEPSTSSVTGWRANRLHHRARSGTRMRPPFKDYYPCGNHSLLERLWSG